MDADYLPFQPNPTRPAYAPPPGAVDAHCHVFGPADVFPYAPQRKYTPCDAPKEKLFALRDFLGFSSATSSSKPPATATIIARLWMRCAASAGLARGVASVAPDISMDELGALHEAGVRGVRFNFVKRLVDATPREVFFKIADKHRPARLAHRRLFRGAGPRGAHPVPQALPTVIVVDHMGRPDIAKGVEHPDFQRFIDLMAANSNIWSKVSCPERLSVSGPPDYADVAPFARTLVQTASRTACCGAPTGRTRT